ncbi:MAG: NUDIX hydrolase [Syntrophales bacterium]|jgi:ADP-ribose pyrophosphatase|nr:NUDIX hydrolase [Syntrophales bacterium]MDD5233981.1 NUDIX hydrolase [Syntrophales bacterium]MDD5532446.1 NUDIX hydrolase [Syntrophales bacterium]
MTKGGPRPNREYPAVPRAGIGAVVIRGGKMLLVKRATPPGAGLWAIPGGLVELGETMQAAAEREILEETGLKIRAGEPVHVFDVIRKGERGAIRCHYVIVDLAAEYVDGEPEAGDDVSGARWLSADELRELPVSPHTLALLKKIGFM